MPRSLHAHQSSEETGWTEGKLSAGVGVSQPAINKLRHEKRTASLGRAIRIEKATGGSVQADDLSLLPEACGDLRMVRGAAA